MFGDQVGTSEKFCAMLQAELFSSVPPHTQIQPDNLLCIAVQSDGCIGERVQQSLDELVKWEEEIRAADVVMIGTHSQGTIISAMILSRLLQQGWLQPSVNQRVGMLCMAGIAHGPFPFLKSNLVVRYVETQAARELFEFCRGGMDVPESKRDSLLRLQKAHQEAVDQEEEDGQSSSSNVDVTLPDGFWVAMKHILEQNVRVISVGSWLDPVVPLYSSLMCAFDHPNLIRAIHIDRHNHSDDFLTNLTVFLIRVRNMGLSDHQVLVQLSDYMAGSLYGGGNEHSTIYDEPQVYR